MSTPYRRPLRPGASSWERWLADVANHGPDPVADPGPGAEPAGRDRWSWKLTSAFAVVWVLIASDSNVWWAWPAVAAISALAIIGGWWGQRVSGPDGEPWTLFLVAVLGGLVVGGGVLVLAAGADTSTVVYAGVVLPQAIDEFGRGLHARSGAVRRREPGPRTADPS